LAPLRDSHLRRHQPLPDPEVYLHALLFALMTAWFERDGDAEGFADWLEEHAANIRAADVIRAPKLRS